MQKRILMSDVAIDFGLRANYTIQVVSIKPKLGDIFYGLNNSDKVEQIVAGEDSPLGKFLQIQHKDQSPWLLEIFGDQDANSSQGIYACPNADYFLAVIDCIAFYISSKLPFYARVIDADYVRAVHSYPNLDFMLIVDFTSMTAIDSSGILWSSNRLVLDELKITSVTNDEIFCEGRQDLSFDDSVVISRLDGRILKRGFNTE